MSISDTRLGQEVEVTPDKWISAFADASESLRKWTELVLNERHRGEDQETANREARWDVLIDRVGKLASLMIKHLDLLDKATAPILLKRDLATTADLIERLVGDVTLPSGYGYFKGAIRRFAEMDGFEDSAKSQMKNILGRVRAFQLDAFMVTPDQWEPDTWTDGTYPSVVRMWSIKNGVTLLVLLSKPDQTAREKVHIQAYSADIMDQLGGITRSQSADLEDLSFQNPEEVTSMIMLYCETWLQRSRSHIWRGRGAHSWIGSLEAERHKKR